MSDEIRKHVDGLVSVYIGLNNVKVNDLGKVSKPDWGMGTVNAYSFNLNGELFEFFQGLGIKTKPCLADLLSSLLMDMGFVQGSFEDFCGEMGYDSDSIAILKLYTAIQGNTKKLERVFHKKSIEELSEVLAEY
ncbi:MAG: hypothetical protein PF440_03025 [Thiomicrorhabdus sp.]|nr:hypothetical protein [Thiomicrorhabdus sp.]